MNSNAHDPMRDALKRAVESQPMPTGLETRIRARLREEAAPKPSPSRAWLWPAFAGVAAVIVAGIFWMRPAPDPAIPSPAEQREYIARVSANVSSMMRVGLGDHIHCALFRKHPPKAPAPALPVQYAGLLEVARRYAPRGYQVTLAHQCSFGKRLFVHLVMKKNRELISLVIATKGDGEAFEAKSLVQGLKTSGLSIYAEDAVDFRVAAYEAKQHFVYVISSMPAQSNTELLLAMSEDVAKSLPSI
jgi:hypothetical protein